MPKTSLSRWTKSESYHATWSNRSDALLNLYRSVFPTIAGTSFSEYGCGPNQPFAKALDLQEAVLRYDIKAWDDGCKVVDLNEPKFQVENTDVAVLSGVLEYMNKPQETLKRLAGFHTYALVSYYPIQNLALRNATRIAEINKRAENNGWRNHLNLDDLVRVVSLSSFPIALRDFQRQVLLLLEFHK